MSAPGETVPIMRPQSRFAGIARLQALAVLLVTLLGSIVPSFGQAFVAELTQPVGPIGMAVDSAGGFLYVADESSGQVLKYNISTRALVATFGAPGFAPGEFNRPYGIAIEPVSGDLYVTERGNGRVQRIKSTTGAHVMMWGINRASFNANGENVNPPNPSSPQGEFQEPIGIAADASGNVYVADHGNDRIQKFTVTGSGTTWNVANAGMWGSTGTANGQFAGSVAGLGPYGIALDSGGNLWVADAGNSRIQRFTSSGTFISAFGTNGTAPGQFVLPTWVNFDSSGNAYVNSTNSNPFPPGAADRDNQWISKFSSTGTFISRFGGTYGEGPGQLRLPFCTVIDSSNRAYVSDYYNGRVQIFDLSTAPGSAPVISSALTATVAANAAFSYTITASNSPTTFTATGLPTGLTFASPTISGTVATPGTYNITIGASNASGSDSKTLVLTVTAPAGSAPVISSPLTATVAANAPFTYTITASNSPTTFTATGLPTGLTFTSPTISGSVATAGTYNITIGASNATGSDSKTLVLTVTAAAGAAPVISSPLTATVAANANFTYTITASNSPTSFTATNRPTGLNFTSPTISGSVATPGTYNITIGASNATGSDSKTLVLTVTSAAGAAPVISSPLTATVAANAAFTYTITASNSPTGFTATNRPTGLNFTSPTISGSVATAGTYNITIGASNATGSDSKTLVLTVTAPAGAAPVVSNGTVTGTVSSAITPFQVIASNSPTSYSVFSGSLPGGLSLAPSTGVISGTPTAAGSSSAVIRATNATGSGNGTISFSIASAPPPPPPPPPPPSGGGGGGGGFTIPQTITFGPIGEAIVDTPMTLTASSSSGLTPITFSVMTGNAQIAGNVITPRATGTLVIRASQAGGGVYQSAFADATINVKAKQTLTFNSPVSAIVINQPIALSATSSAGLPISYSIVSGNATIAGNVLTPRGLGPIVVRATAASSDNIAAATTDVNFGSPQKAAQAITFNAIADTAVTASPIALNATSTSGLPITYSLVGGPATLSGNVLTLTRAVGVVSIRASQGGNDLYNPAADITRSFSVGAIGQQVYMGTIGSEPFAVVISADNRRGLFLTRFSTTGEAIVAKFIINPNGTFSATGTGSTPDASGSANALEDTPATAAATQTRTITGTVANGVVTGSIAELNRTFTANVSSPTGSTASLAGVYVATMPGSASGDTYVVVGPNGQAFAVAITPMGVTSGSGSITTDGAISINTANGGSLSGSVDAATGVITGTLNTGTATAALVGLSEGATRSDRLVNLSSRLRVVSGDDSRSVIAGFVVSGTESKQVLVRAVGPGLTAFGVTDALANPKLQLFNGNTLIAENDDWNNAADVSTTGDNVGAFKLGTSSRDSALVANLAPGAYTAVVTGVSGNGVALIEVYDAASNAPIASQELVNISTRGFVDTGEGNLIAGFVVTGNAPKRVLIRGIGPGLSQFSVPGAVTDPMLRLYAAGNTTVLAQNDNWGTPQPVSASQVAATSADIAAASTATGAFPLTANSRDAAIVITLMPGQYSAVVSGVNNATGAGLVEVYELTNP